ncbi:MAG: PP2C family protein-serine/threonine phosphatase [Flavobacteriales bacterium]
MCLGLVFLVYRGYKQKRKTSNALAMQKAQIEEVNKNITDSIIYASRIQNAILPDKNDLNKLFRDSFIFYRPRDIVSGDFYWFWTDDVNGVLAVADCTGHGVPGAFMSMIGQDLLNQIVKDGKILNASQILRTMDHKVSSHLNKKGSKEEYNDGMDIGVLVFNKEEKTAHFSGAYRSMLQVRGKYIIEHPSNKFSIGGVQDSSCKLFYNSDVEFREGDALYIFSDGFADQFGGAKGKKFMNKRFSDLLLDLHPKEMREQEELLKKIFDEWRGEEEQVDDVLVVGVRV